MNNTVPKQNTEEPISKSDAQGDYPTVKLTKAAAQRIRELSEAEDDTKSLMLRIAVDGGGCSGFSYQFSMENDVQDDDIAFEYRGAVLLVDKVSLEILSGSEVDFVDDLQSSSFRVNNPKAVSTCGCGTSFSI
ncbi:MAG: iron-sulfur cluster insertion protein ErpA [Candidatus Marinimicrobia bacterium]|nr:iron-sulfur cluster insertion protein ErpA [Candidatus Neomarinimicrobiota bacterium]